MLRDSGPGSMFLFAPPTPRRRIPGYVVLDYTLPAHIGPQSQGSTTTLCGLAVSAPFWMRTYSIDDQTPVCPACLAKQHSRRIA